MYLAQARSQVQRSIEFTVFKFPRLCESPNVIVLGYDGSEDVFWEGTG
jgi:hypothetical protein